ncbi:hypothetical protein BBJ28_00015646 [Nothophytophthora sp. Chile5]|nr:hypothetical protein BBJ28_00015646 [Nothophytophthora sp. Chile5]
MADAPPAPKKLTKKDLRELERQKAAVHLTDTYGEKPLIQSQEHLGNVYKSYTILHESGEVTTPMIKFTADVPKESIMDVFVTQTVPRAPVLITTQTNVDLSVQNLFVINKVLRELHF